MANKLDSIIDTLGDSSTGSGARTCGVGWYLNEVEKYCNDETLKEIDWSSVKEEIANLKREIKSRISDDSFSLELTNKLLHGMYDSDITGNANK